MHNRIFIVTVTPQIQIRFPEFIYDNRRFMIVDEGCDCDIAYFGDLEQAEELRRILSRFELVQDGSLRIRIDECDRDQLEEQVPNRKINYFYPEGLVNDETPELPALELYQVKDFIFPVNQSAVPRSRLLPPSLNHPEEPMIFLDGFNI